MMIKKVIFSFAVVVGLSFALMSPGVFAQPKQDGKVIQQARKLSDEGDKFFRQKNYRLAIERYQRASTLVPNFPHATFYKGYSHYNLQQFDQALESFNLALSQGYTPIEVYKVRWFVYYQLKDFDNSLKDIQEVLKIDTTNGALMITEGDIYQSKNMDREAVAAYENASKVLPENGDLYYSTAFSYAKLTEYPSAGIAALKAIQKNTRFLGESWYLVGLGLQSERKFTEAAEAYEKSISAKPEIADSSINLANIYQIQNRYEDALNVLKKATEFNAENGTIYINMSWLYSLTDRNMDSVAAGKKAIALLPDNPMGYTNLCRAYNDLKEYDLAVEKCLSALRLDPDDGETHSYLARAYAFQKRTELSNTHYKKAIPGLVKYTRQNPDYPEGFYLLGNAYLAGADFANAIGEYKKSLNLNPKFTKALFNLGYAYVLRNDRASARLQYNELLKIDPSLAKRLLDEINAK